MKAFFVLAAAGLALMPPLNAQKSTPPAAPAAAPVKGAVELYQEGVAAFQRGDMVTAKDRLQRVQAANPQHQPTRIYLNQILQAEMAARRQSGTLEGRMKQLIVDKVDFSGAKVEEVLEFIQMKGQQLAGNGVKPNLIFNLNTMDKQQEVTVHLSKISMYDLLRSVSEIASLEVRYDTHTINVLSKSVAAVAEPGAAEAKK